MMPAKADMMSAASGKEEGLAIDIEGEPNTHPCLFCAQSKKEEADIVCHFVEWSIRCGHCVAQNISCAVIPRPLLLEADRLMAIPVTQPNRITMAAETFVESVCDYCVQTGIERRDFHKSAGADRGLESGLHDRPIIASSSLTTDTKSPSSFAFHHPTLPDTTRARTMTTSKRQADNTEPLASAYPKRYRSSSDARGYSSMPSGKLARHINRPVTSGSSTLARPMKNTANPIQSNSGVTDIDFQPATTIQVATVGNQILTAIADQRVDNTALLDAIASMSSRLITIEAHLESLTSRVNQRFDETVTEKGLGSGDEEDYSVKVEKEWDTDDNAV